MFYLDKEIIKVWIYDDEEIIYFLKNLFFVFGKDFKVIKVYIIKEYDVNKFKILGNVYIEL